MILGVFPGMKRVVHSLALLINVMGEFRKLAKKFELEEELYYGGCSEIIITKLLTVDR